MCLLKVTKGGIHLGHLLLENTTSQVEPRLRRKLLYAKRKEVHSYFEGAMVEGHLGERQVCDSVLGTQLDRFSEPFNRLRRVVVGFGKLGSDAGRLTIPRD